MKQAEAREQALGALYAADSRSLEEIDVTNVSLRAAKLAEGTWNQREDIDKTITRCASNWRIERMPVVDRNIIRLGVYELESTDLPIGIVISEAVELAKRFSTAKSGSFINGVLSAVARDTGEEPNETTT
ncbi:MAG: transcription antitermination factor NusB [Acidimicrobiia bacterium]|nr:MAG: transcription antitermination factor NusB [Acidimicrobiia bacterium]